MSGIMSHASPITIYLCLWVCVRAEGDGDDEDRCAVIVHCRRAGLPTSTPRSSRQQSIEWRQATAAARSRQTAVDRT